jgi:N-acetylgalactosamine kinase
VARVEECLTGVRAGSLDPRMKELFSSVEDVVRRERERLLLLLEDFRRRFPAAEAVTVVRAPGRVNLIGEHTDYNGYPVLPMAIDRDILVALGPTEDGSIEIANVDPKFGARSFAARLPLERFAQGDWGNYVKAAVNGLLEEPGLLTGNPRGFVAVFSGDIPGSAGLSSSSALVVASALAFLAAQPVAMDPMALADLLAKAERYTGSQGGGMDQAVSLNAQAGKAVKIDFGPLRIQPIRLPGGFRYVVCHSLVLASKTGAALDSYNMRVAECRMAVALLRHALSSRVPRDFRPTLLSHFASADIGVTPEELDEIARHALGPKALSRTSLSVRLGLAAEEVRTRFLSARDGSTLPVPRGGFKVWKRYRHVISEAHRVEEASVALEHGDARRFGELMNASHQSCRDDYEISCQELDELVAVARNHGAWGARLTGAGFGGCTINLVPEESLEQFVRGVSEEYYARRCGNREAATSAVFVCIPVKGAGILIE